VTHFSTTPGQWFTPAALAAKLGVDVGKTLDWIHSGQLRAVNCATRGNGRPRWRIRPEDWAEFVRKRQSSTAPPPRQRRRRSEGVIDYF
jgi:Helix-turn-helix domain